MRMTDPPTVRRDTGEPGMPSSGITDDGAGFGVAEAALLVAMVAVFVFLQFRNAGLHPSIFADEWNYSMSSRLVKLSTVGTPLYVYMSLYRWTKHCGDAYLECARTLNALFFVAAAPLIYLTARRVASRPLALLVAMLSLLGSINTYTAYFMPEAMYFFVFWLLTWFAVGRRQSRPAWYGAGIGALLGILVLVKVNAVFLLPGLAAFVLYNGARGRAARGWRTAMVTLGAMLVAAAVVRFGIGIVSAGTAGLNLLGTRYGSLANSSLTATRL
jgi:4-amino-4-deoxy-L-arabinose transferase-like glycosyltransferase